jgi:hypothetical protein
LEPFKALKADQLRNKPTDVGGEKAKLFAKWAMSVKIRPPVGIAEKLCNNKSVVFGEFDERHAEVPAGLQGGRKNRTGWRNGPDLNLQDLSSPNLAVDVHYI